MNRSAAMETMDALRDLGFQPSDDPLSGSAGLVYHFERFDLEAGFEDFRFRILLCGNFESPDPRTLFPPVEIYLPAQVISREQCAAMIAYYLRGLPIQGPPSWLVQGGHSHDLLPWNIDSATRKAAYDALPKCLVKREWLRLALKTLSVQIASVKDDTVVEFEFTSGVLSIRCNGNLIVLPGRGDDWPQPVTIRAGEFRILPKRFMTDEIAVIVRDLDLSIGNGFSVRVLSLPGNNI